MKKFISVMCILIVFSCMFTLFLPKTYAADVSYNKKIVSVVYDDSGSMSSKNKYVYANYAMQTFCSLLGAEDELYITYMNQRVNSQKIGTHKFELSDASVQSSVNDIRAWATPNGTTPYGSVMSAMDVLRNAKDTNEKTEYILLVITDGEFSDYESPEKQQEVRNDFAAFADERMANGTKAQVIYLAIGNSVLHLNLNTSNIKEFYANDESSDKTKGIVAKMSEIADLVSGRSRISGSAVKVVNDRTVEISSSVPLSNIAVLMQGSSGKVTSVKHKESGKTLNVGRNISSYCTGFPDLSSQSFLIQSGKDNIPSGTYVMTFDQAIDPKNLIVMFEPALELRLSVHCNGRELDKLTELDLLHEKDLISVSYEIYEYGTDNVVNLADLPSGTSASLAVYENGVEKKKVNGAQNTLRDYSLNLAKTEFRAVLQLPNFNPIEAYIDFTPLKYIHYTVGAEYGNGSDSVKLTEITGNHNFSLIFTLYADNVPVTDPNIVKAFMPKVTLSPENGNDGTTTVRNDGKIVFVPTKASGAGEIKATCTVNGVSCSKTYKVIAPVYQIHAEYGSAANSVKLTEITKQHDLSIVFTVTEDGVRITDKTKLESIAKVTWTTGNEGAVTYTNDGKIIFVPTKASGAGSVTVTCQVESVSANKTYNVIAPVYQIHAEYGNNADSVKLKDIAGSHDLSIVFTVTEDGVRITDKTKLESIAKVTWTTGNEGAVTYTNDGKIIFVPTKASGAGSVTVTCQVESVSASKEYSVLESNYSVKAEFKDGKDSIKLTEIKKQHGLSIIFTVWEDGVLITDKAKVEALGYTITCTDGHNGDRTVTDNGEIIFVPTEASGAGSVTVTCEAGGYTKTMTYTIMSPTYQVQAEYGSDVKEVHFDYIDTNHGISLIFTIWEDGVRITDKSVIEAIMPKITYSEDGSDGERTVTDDGKIIVTPKEARGKTDTAFYDVYVTCTAGDSGATLSYRVILPNIQIVVIPPETPIEKHKFHGNTTSISFYVVKDGNRLSKADVQNCEVTILNEKYSHLVGNVEIMEDGTVIFTPTDENEHKINFFNWFVNWWWYWWLPNKDMTVQFVSDYGVAEGVIPVSPAPICWYQILTVFLPFILVVAFVGFLIRWSYCILIKATKLKFPKDRIIVAGKIFLGKDPATNNYYHKIVRFTYYPLKDFNTWRYILKPTLTPLEVEIESIIFTATKTGPQCKEIFFRGNVFPLDGGGPWNCDKIENYLRKHKDLKIKEFFNPSVAPVKNQTFTITNAKRAYLFPTERKKDPNTGVSHIKSATILFYI